MGCRRRIIPDVRAAFLSKSCGETSSESLQWPQNRCPVRLVPRCTGRHPMGNRSGFLCRRYLKLFLFLLQCNSVLLTGGGALGFGWFNYHRSSVPGGIHGHHIPQTASGSSIAPSSPAKCDYFFTVIFRSCRPQRFFPVRQ